MTHFRPRTKEQLITFLGFYWPQDVECFKRKTKGVLYGIYYRVIADVKRGKYPSTGVSE